MVNDIYWLERKIKNVETRIALLKIKLAELRYELELSRIGHESLNNKVSKIKVKIRVEDKLDLGDNQ